MKCKTIEEVKQVLIDYDCEDTVVFENPDYAEAFIGVDLDDRAVYDFEMMVQHLIKTDNMSYEEAAEFIDYNTVRSLPYIGDKAPIIIRNLVE